MLIVNNETSDLVNFMASEISKRECQIVFAEIRGLYASMSHMIIDRKCINPFIAREKKINRLQKSELFQHQTGMGKRGHFIWAKSDELKV